MIADHVEMLIETNGFFVHIAAFVMLIGLTMRDRLHLAAVVGTGNLFYALYYYLGAEEPLWDALFWSTAMFVTNMVMLIRISRSRKHRRVSDDELRVYAAFDALEPGDFRMLMAAGSMRTAERETILTELGEHPDSLYYVISGGYRVDRADRSLDLAGPAFVAELAFLLGSPASATVRLEPGGRYCFWNSARLKALLARNDRLARCVERALNRDLASKLHGGGAPGERGARTETAAE